MENKRLQFMLYSFQYICLFKKFLKINKDELHKSTKKIIKYFLKFIEYVSEEQ